MSPPKTFIIFAPGAPPARLNGCLCDASDNAHGAGMDHGTGEPVYAINVDCPIHGTWTPVPKETIAEADSQCQIADVRYKAAVGMWGLESLEARAAFEVLHEAHRLSGKAFSAVAATWHDDDW